MRMACVLPQVSSIPAGILIRDPAFLITFHGKGDRTASRNGVHPGPVEQLIDLIDQLQVLIQQHGCERGRGFIFRFMAFLSGGGDLNQPPASQRASAAMVLAFLRLDHEIWIDGPVDLGQVSAGSGPVLKWRIAHDLPTMERCR